MPPRKPHAGRTLVFSRAQVKYQLYANYLHRFLDRPLFHDRATYVKDRKHYILSLPSFAKISRAAMQYDMDGLGIFGDVPASRLPMLEAADAVAPPGFRVLLEWSGSRDPALKSKSIEAALASKSAYRVGDKLLITSYHFGAWKPPELGRFLTEMRSRHGDVFLFLADVTSFCGESILEWLRKFDEAGALTEEDGERIKAHLRPYLEVADGLHFSAVHMLRTRDRKFHHKFYAEALVPLLRSLLDEPAHEGKLLGLSACVGYFYFTGSTLNEDGTKTLRRSLETAMSASPDVIVLPEWDEANENTSFRPTVHNSFSTQRTVKYCMHRLKGEAPSPNPGDDTTIPNLVVSYRRFLTLGETLEIELLNVPDSPAPARYSATVVLKGLHGNVAKRFPRVNLDAGAMQDRTLAVPTEELADHPVLAPSVTVRGPGGRSRTFERGLHHIRLRATWNWDCKWVKQPLRDLCLPSEASFGFAGTTGGPEVSLAGKFACAEDIASVEVLENGGEVYAVDPANEYFRDGDDVPVLVEIRSLRRKPLQGLLRVRNATCKWPESFREPSSIRRLEGDVLKFTSRADWYTRAALFAVPSEEVDQAVLDLDFTVLKTAIPLKRVLDNGIYAETHDDGLTVLVSRSEKLFQHPLHLHRKQVAFAARVRPETRTSVFHMRVITESGKIFRSPPLMLPGWQAGRKTELTVHSESRKGVVPVKVDAARIPDLDYTFDPRYGSVFHTAAGRPFYASLGAYETTCTGRGGGEARIGGYPFRLGMRNYPDNARQTAPTWTVEDGRQCLKFDGVGNFIVFPHETIPRRGSYALSFEIKPMSAKPQVLFAHHGYYIGSLVVNLNDGKLSARFVDQYCKSWNLESGLVLKIGEWNKVEVIYDLEHMVFAVNGVRSAPMPCPGPGLYITPAIFGGFGKGGDKPDFVGNSGWFEGWLRSLRVRHSACE